MQYTQPLTWLKHRTTWRGIYWTIGGLLLIVLATLLIVFDLRNAWAMATSNHDQCLWNIDFTGQTPSSLAGCTDYIGWTTFLSAVKDSVHAFSLFAIFIVEIYFIILMIRDVFKIKSRSQGFVMKRLNTMDKRLKFTVVIGAAMTICYLLYRNLLSHTERFTTTACVVKDFACGPVWNWQPFIEAVMKQLGLAGLVITAAMLVYALGHRFLREPQPEPQPLTREELLELNPDMREEHLPHD